MSVYYVDPTGGDDGDSGGLGDPFLTIDHVWGVVGPDDTVFLLDDLTGGYTGDDNMIRPPASFGGTADHPITIKALNDGMVLIDGEGSRLPLLLDGNVWLDFEGFNAAHSDESVTEGVITTNNFSHDINFRRIVAWDGSQSENSQVFETNNSQRVLWEDCAGFGTGRKMFSIYESEDCTARRCWGQWQDNVAVNPQLVFTNYSSYGSRFENCIATWDGGHTMYSPGLFIAGQMTGASTMPWSDSTLNSHTIFEGCIGYQLGSQAGYWDAGGIDAGAFVDYITFKDMAFYSEQNVFGYTYSDLRVVPEFGNSIPHQSAIAQNITVILPDPSTSGGGNNDGWGQRETPGEWTRTNENRQNSVAAAYPSGQSLFSNDGSHGATIRFEVVDGVTTTTPLFPWKMNGRIIDAMATTAYTVRDVTDDVYSIFGVSPDDGTGTERFVSDSGSGATFSRVSPGNVADAVAASVAGDIITMLDGTYTGDDYMLIITGTSNGVLGNPIIVRADHDGGVKIDGESSRTPFSLIQDYWLIQGINFCNAVDSVINIGSVPTGANHCTIKRCCAWNANVDVNAAVWGVVYSHNILIEDCAGFGTGRKIFANFNSSFVTTRRCWAMWNGSNSTSGPMMCFSLAYDSLNCVSENCIATQDQVIAPPAGMSFGTFAMDRITNEFYDGNIVNYQTNSRYEGCIGYFRSGQTMGDMDGNSCIFLGRSFDKLELKNCVQYAEPGVFSGLGGINAQPFDGQGGCADPGCTPHGDLDAVGDERKITNVTLIGMDYNDIDTDGPGNGWTVVNLNDAATVAAAYGAENLFENDGTKGATIKFEIVDGVTTTTPLFPWKMNQRIKDAITDEGTLTVRDVNADIYAIFGTPPDVTPGGTPPIDTFDDATPTANLAGRTGGSGDWLGGYVQGEGNTMTTESGLGSNQGGIAVRSLTGGDGTYYYRQFLNVATGSFKFEMMSDVANPDNEYYGYSLHEAGVSIRVNIHFSSGGNIEAWDAGTASYINLGAFSPDVWYNVEIALDATGHPGQFRVKIDDGSFSAWLDAYGTMTVVNMLQFNNYSTNGAIHFDAIGATTAPVAENISQLILDKILKDLEFAMFPVWVSAHTGPTGLTGASEVVGGSYGRVSAPETSWGTAANRKISNILDIQFSPMPSTTITWIGLWSASSGGTFIRGVPLDNPLPVKAGATPKFSAGGLSLQFTNDFSTYLANVMLEYLFKGTSFTSAAAYWSAHTGAKDDTGGNEVTGGSYARQIATIADWEDTGASILGDTIFSLDFEALVEFAGMPASTLTRLGLFDAASSGHFLMWGPPKSLVVGAGETVSIDGTVAGNLAATLTQVP